jgi:hypothetical protein
MAIQIALFESYSHDSHRFLRSAENGSFPSSSACCAIFGWKCGGTATATTSTLGSSTNGCQAPNPRTNAHIPSESRRARCVRSCQRDDVAADVMTKGRHKDRSPVIATDDADADHDRVSVRLPFTRRRLICLSIGWRFDDSTPPFYSEQ